MCDTPVFVAIPAMDELHDLPLTLQDLAAQTYSSFSVYICVNQPDAYWHDPEKVDICHRNQQLMALLQQYRGLSLHLIDKTSEGKGWTGNDYGVGWARKLLFENILTQANDGDIIISLDADTRIHPDYIRSIAHNFSAHPTFPAIAVPYYHPLSGIELYDKALLRYELYMRNYAINLMRINSPYGFTAIGSAIAMRAGALRKIGGITPLKSGEDFYLVQKFRKMAPIGNYNDECVYPAARVSDRVIFGTGPAILKGSRGDWNSYPIYHQNLFKEIAEAYQQIPTLYHTNIANTFLDSLNKKQNKEDLWQKIRQNTRDLAHFEQAFHEKADGLRILQFLRQQQQSCPISDEKALFDNLTSWVPDQIPSWFNAEQKIQVYSVEQLNELRDILFKLEMEYRKSID